MFKILIICFTHFVVTQAQSQIGEFEKCKDKLCSEGERIKLTSDHVVIFQENSDSGGLGRKSIGTWQASGDSLINIERDNKLTSYVRHLAFDIVFLVSKDDDADWNIVTNELKSVIETDVTIKTIGEDYGEEGRKKAIKKAMPVLLPYAWGTKFRDIYVERELTPSKHKRH